MTNFLGVLGGMGPLATADFLKKIVDNTAVLVDQEHVPILLYGDCTIPDRTANILGEGLSPLPKLLEGVKFLSRSGVRAICIPCNSVHRWFVEIEAASSVPVLHIAKASIAQIGIKKPSARVIGVMSTLGTFRTGIYQDALAEMGFEVLTPSEDQFESFVSPGIAFVKSNMIEKAEKLFEKVAIDLFMRGAEIIILGCTEIPIGMKNQYCRTPSSFVDSTDALALSAINFLAGKAHRITSPMHRNLNAEFQDIDIPLPVL